MIYRAGTFTIGLVTAQTANFEAGAKVTATLNVDPAPLTITGVTATNRAYESGNTTVSITGGTLQGVFGGDTVSPVVPPTGTIATADAGTGKAVAVGTITLSGADAGKYALTQLTGITVNISAAAIQGAVTIEASTAAGDPIGDGDTLTANVAGVTPSGATLS